MTQNRIGQQNAPGYPREARLSQSVDVRLEMIIERRRLDGGDEINRIAFGCASRLKAGKRNACTA